MKSGWRWLGTVALAGVALQAYFALRIALMVWLDPQSTAFERSQAWRLYAGGNAAAAGTTPARGTVAPTWRQSWAPYERISEQLKRAVMASEDSEFAYHDGVDWEALKNAWHKNAQAQEQAARQAKLKRPGRGPKIIGGSTITQQLAKNLFLSGERTLLRKGQELVLTLLLEAFLDKQRLLEIYLNHVEWGNGVFGAQAAAQRYYGKSAADLGALDAARLAVMLPRPRYFERLPNSEYLAQRAQVIVGRMGAVELP